MTHTTSASSSRDTSTQSARERRETQNAEYVKAEEELRKLRHAKDKMIENLLQEAPELKDKLPEIFSESREESSEQLIKELKSHVYSGFDEQLIDDIVQIHSDVSEISRSEDNESLLYPS